MSENKPKISGVNLPVIPAEPAVVEAFDKYREKAVVGVQEETDCMDEISGMIAQAREPKNTPP